MSQDKINLLQTKFYMCMQVLQEPAKVGVANHNEALNILGDVLKELKEVKVYSENQSQ